MSVIYIRGGGPLEGELAVHGAKNSVLPILAACLLARGPVTLHNCPRLTDVDAALGILRRLGCRVEQEGHVISVDPAGASGCSISEEQMRAMRSSIIFLGPLLARAGEAHLTYPGGCELGPRPIDLHLSAIRALGCEVTEDRGIHCLGRPRGGEIQLAMPSVGATENAMLCAVGADGPTTITNAAREPEIGDLQGFLNLLGADVRGAGSSTITVEGGRALSGGEYTVMGDRIVAATLLSAAVSAFRSDINDVIRRFDHIQIVLDHHHRISALCQSVQNLHQFVHICKMQSCGGFVQNIDRPARTLSGKFRGKLHTLSLSAGKLRGRLSQFNIRKPHVIQRFYLSADARHILKKSKRFLHRHIQHVKNTFPFIFYIQCFPVVAFSAADLAGYIYIRQKMHFYL